MMSWFSHKLLPQSDSVVSNDILIILKLQILKIMNNLVYSNINVYNKYKLIESPDDIMKDSDDKESMKGM